MHPFPDLLLFRAEPEKVAQELDRDTAILGVLELGVGQNLDSSVLACLAELLVGGFFYHVGSWRLGATHTVSFPGGKVRIGLPEGFGGLFRRDRRLFRWSWRLFRSGSRIQYGTLSDIDILLAIRAERIGF